MKEKILLFWQEHRILVLISAGYIILVSLGCLFLLIFYHRSSSKQYTPGSVPVPQQAQGSDVYFATYRNTATLPEVPQSVSVYTLKNNFTYSEIAAFAAKFGIHTVTQSAGNSNFAYNAIDIPTKSIFFFKKDTGVFSYQSKNGLKPNGFQPGQKNTSEALSELQQLGIADATVTCNITYQRRSSPGVTYIECHRDWIKAGLPIFNFNGLLNTPQTTPLSSFALGRVDAIDFPDDNDIINVSGVAGYIPNGKARPDEFNTATISIGQDGTIFSIDSNLRWITKTETLPSAINLLTAQQALQEFIDHKDYLSSTVPLGSGIVDLQKVYQDNKAVAQEATITDYVLSYLEKTPDETQQFLVPMYTIRGTATLTTGYRVSFIQTVPALKDGRTFLTHAIIHSAINASHQWWLSNLFSKILGVVYADNKQLQLSTFNPASPQPSKPSLGSSTSCFDYSSLTFADPSKSRFLQHGITKLDQSTFTVSGAGTLKLAYNLAVALGAAGGWASNMVFYESSSFPVAGVSGAADNFYGLVTNQYTINVARHLATDQSGALNASSTIDDVKNLFAKINGGECPATPPMSNAAPEYNCSPSSNPRGNLNTDRMNSVADATAQQVLSDLTNNTIGTIANQQDIFPFSGKGIFVSIDTSSWNKSLNSFLAPLAPCYLAGEETLVEGASPSLFLHSSTRINVSITLPSFLTYADPGITSDNTWHVTAFPDGTLQDNSGVTYQNLYFEYDQQKAVFSQQREGFVTPYDRWKDTVDNNIAKPLGLTQQETTQLRIEVQNALYGQAKTPYLFLSLIPQNEINQQLPLSIHPNPDSFYRIEILISPLQKNITVSKPTLQLLKRNGFTVVELGARLP